MRKVMQSLKNGNIELIDVPTPSVYHRHILIETRKSLISAGTERMLIEFGKGNLIQKAMKQPEKVKQTLDKAKTDGISATINAVTSKLDQPIPLGYCNAGIVREVGNDVNHVKVGDRVVSNGSHSEVVCIARNLVTKIPDEVSFEEAAFTPLAAIALQGIRLAKPTLGETFCVMGLGLVGLMTVQLLRANGCNVIGADFDTDRLSLAKSWGANVIDLSKGEDPVVSALSLTQGRGVDGVIIAVATDSQDPMRQATEMCRKRGRIVLVGVTGLNLSRDEFFQKELTFQVSCSYGPGRYDTNYEDRGEDYPEGYVRWTEQRNFDAVLGAMANKTLDVHPLISKTIYFSDASTAYSSLTQKGEKTLGLILDYPEGSVDLSQTTIRIPSVTAKPETSSAVVALIGAGGFGSRVTAPGLKAAGARLKTIVTRGGVSGAVEGRKTGFEEASTDMNAVLNDPEIDTVVITTRHDSHAKMTVKALNAGKHVFVEKPLAMTHEDIDMIEKAYQAQIDAGTPRHLMIGFNRRFSPFSIKMKSLLDNVTDPKCLIAVINAGSIPKDHWVHDPEQGGGRIMGEGCHMIDLMRFFVGTPITGIKSTTINRPTSDGVSDDKTSISMNFEDGSIATLHYFANGPASLSKERYEAFAGNKYLMIDNFKSLTSEGWPRSASMKGKQDKGHNAALAAFIEAIQNGNPTPISFEEIIEVSRLSIDAVG